MEPVNYTIIKIDGDYALLSADGAAPGDTILVARALLPMEIEEGGRLRYENLSYEIID